ncbi:MAG: malate synthase A, partial [Terracidiphilus sp.]
VHAIGGMSAYIPNKRDAAANQVAMEQVRADKEREASDGHDGTWVAHPGLVGIAKEIFDRIMPQPNQISRKLEDVHVTAADLLEVPKADITEAGLRQNIAVGIGYLESWLRGIGCVPLFNLMEDAATAEISRAQLWQWVHQKSLLNDGRAVTVELCNQIITEELAKFRQSVGEEQYRAGKYEEAANLVRDLIKSPNFIEFLTLPAYDRLREEETASAN